MCLLGNVRPLPLSALSRVIHYLTLKNAAKFVYKVLFDIKNNSFSKERPRSGQAMTCYRASGEPEGWRRTGSGHSVPLPG